MSITTRYILREFLRIFLVAAAALALVELSLDVLERVRHFHKYDPEFIWLLKYFFFRLPRVFFETLPLTSLLTTLITFGALSKHNEITAFKSTGMPIFRLALPLLLFGGGMSLLSYHLTGTLIPKLYKRAGQIRTIQIEKKKPSGGFIQNKTWLHLDRHRLIFVQVVSSDKARMQGVQLYALGDDFTIIKETEAEELIYTEGEWTLLNGIQRHFLPEGEVVFKPFIRKKIEINKKPDDFRQVSIEKKEMTYKNLESYISQLASVGFETTRFKVDLRAKQALPFANFIMVLLGVPFALRDSRSGGIAWGIAISLAVALFYWLVFSITLSLGRLEILPPWLAAWSANILLLSMGSYLFMKVRQ